MKEPTHMVVGMSGIAYVGRLVADFPSASGFTRLEDACTIRPGHAPGTVDLQPRGEVFVQVSDYEKLTPAAAKGLGRAMSQAFEAQRAAEAGILVAR